MVVCCEQMEMVACVGQTETGQNVVEIVLVGGLDHTESLCFLSLDLVGFAAFY